MKKQKPLEVMRPGERNEFWEAILRMQIDEPKRFALLSPGLKISAGKYAENRSQRVEKEAKAA